MRNLLDLLTLNEEAPDRFVAPNGRGGWNSLFGGQIIAQALAAATRTVEKRKPVNSLHAYFMRPGAFDAPIEFAVTRERDGGSFANRRVVAAQSGKEILSAILSFHSGEAGPVRESAPFPGVPDPEMLATVTDAATAYGRDPDDPSPLTYVDVRPVDGCQPFVTRVPEPPTGTMWFRFRDGIGGSSGMGRAMIAYVSDLFLINTAFQPHRAEAGKGTIVTSIDHSVWFHEDPVDDWMLYVQDSPWASHGRTMCRGTIFARDGRRIATIAQEGLLRLGQ